MFTINDIQIHTLQLASSKANIAELDPFLEELISTYRISSENYGNLITAVNEAVSNAVIHGNKENPEKKVYINVEMNEDQNKIIFEISDEGDGFDFRTLPDPTSPENIDNDYGRGVYIMKQISDRLIFNDKGNGVELHFYL